MQDDLKFKVSLGYSKALFQKPETLFLKGSFLYVFTFSPSFLYVFEHREPWLT